jgi:transposase
VLARRIEELLPSWSMAPVVTTLQAMRGIALVVAVTVVAEVGDFRRFAKARQLMAYLGLVPSEHSSGARCAGLLAKSGSRLKPATQKKSRTSLCCCRRGWSALERGLGEAGNHPD